MKIAVVTLFPELYAPFVSTSLIGRAQEQGQAEIHISSLFDVCRPKERVDSPTFGHGAGMVLRPEVIERAVDEQEKLYGATYKIFFSPQGRALDQEVLHELKAQADNGKTLLLLPARYEGMDARVEEQYADCLLSVGDFVLMGGDLPAMMLVEGLLRLVPGVVGKPESVERDSFTGPFVDYPEYAEPVVWKDKAVPDVVRSGDHAKLAAWRREQAATKTVLHHFEWLRTHVSDQKDIQDAGDRMPDHYAVLMHDKVLLPDQQEGRSSVTSLDIHDIARSARTYGIKKYIMVTPLEDQQRIIQKLLQFWQTGVGVEYNPHRHEALERVVVVSSLEEAEEIIKKETGKDPVLVATTARPEQKDKAIGYKDQEKVWALGRPVVFVFGTARGLAPSVLERADFVMKPLKGFSSFNHLSVRSAAAILFDRWLGIYT